MKIKRAKGWMRSFISRTILAGLILVFSLDTYAKGNVIMRGALVTEPCVIAPGDETIKLEFGSIVDKYLYLNQRTHGQEFTLRLSDCDLSLGNNVRIMFSGVESQELPGLLAIDASSQAKGIAIGLESKEGNIVSINKFGKNTNLHVNNNSISLSAYVQGEPQSLISGKINLGYFNATVVFELEYE